MAKTILVTGAAGFIGSHTSARLLARGDRVVGLDNLNDYYSPERKRQNVAEVRAGAPEASAFGFVEGDIRDRALLGRCTSPRWQACARRSKIPGSTTTST
jgi:UDP-glucuronate 4-epimerase